MAFDALSFLESLFRVDPVVDPAVVPSVAPAADTTLPELTPNDLSGDWFVVWDERAAIMEFDGNMPREVAEHYALLDVLKMMKAGGTE